MKTVGPPYSGKLNVRWDGKGMVNGHERDSEALQQGNRQKTDRPCLKLLSHSFTLDLVVLARHQNDRLSGWIEAKLETWMGLEINREKTQVVDLKEVGNSLDFLGFTFRFDRSLYKNWKKRYLNVFVSDRSVAREREKLRELTARRRSCMPVPRMISEVNRQLTGWGNYFNYGYPRKAFRKVNSFLELRLIAHLKRRSQRPFRTPKGRSVHDHLKKLGLVNL